MSNLVINQNSGMTYTKRLSNEESNKIFSMSTLLSLFGVLLLIVFSSILIGGFFETNASGATMESSVVETNVTR